MGDVALLPVPGIHSPDYAFSNPASRIEITALAVRNGLIASSVATGYARLYANPDEVLSKIKRIKAKKKNRIFDLDSLTKTFTATALTQLMAKKKVKLKAPAARYLPVFAMFLNLGSYGDARVMPKNWAKRAFQNYN